MGKAVMEPTKLPVVDVWASDQGATWRFKPTTDKGHAFCSENLGTLSEAQRQGESFVVVAEVVIAIIRHMTEEGLYVKEVLH